MSEPEEIDSFLQLAEDMSNVAEKLTRLQKRVHARLHDHSSRWESTYQIAMIQESQRIQRIVRSLCDDLLNNKFADPSLVRIRT